VGPGSGHEGGWGGSVRVWATVLRPTVTRVLAVLKPSR
jgi:hypothetical protein